VLTSLLLSAFAGRTLASVKLTDSLGRRDNHAGNGAGAMSAQLTKPEAAVTVFGPDPAQSYVKQLDGLRVVAPGAIHKHWHHISSVMLFFTFLDAQQRLIACESCSGHAEQRASTRRSGPAALTLTALGDPVAHHLRRRGAEPGDQILTRAAKRAEVVDVQVLDTSSWPPRQRVVRELACCKGGADGPALSFY